jgi:putative endonuclease
MEKESVSGKRSGDWGEALTAEYLRERGYRIVASKYRCRYGEIDLIASDGETICFVEVKLRSNLGCGLPREYVTEAKKKRLRTTAQFYLASHDPDALCRFDVAEVYTDRGHSERNTHIEYIENAF